MADCKEAYGSFQEKYSLPSFEDLDNEFEIANCEGNILREIRRKIMEKISEQAGIIENILNPDSSFTSLEECQHFENKEELSELFKKIKFIERSSLELDLVCDDAKEAECIKYSYQKLNELKPTLIEIAKKIKATWVHNGEANEKMRYMG